MKAKIFICSLFTAATALAFSAQAQTTPTGDNEVPLLVEVPNVPDHISRLDQRCNYIVDKYWERANLKSAFSSLDRMDATFGQFLAFTPYATADTVHMAIDRLIKGVEKADAKNLVPLARIAEKWCAGDSAEYSSEELLYPFVEAVAKNKKVKGADKTRYQALYTKLANSRLGATVSNFDFTCPDGSTGQLDDIKAPHILLIFYEPDCFDCRMARVRLSSDYILPTLIDNGLLQVVAIYPGDADADWQTDAENMPAGWVVGANPNIDTQFTIEHTPEIYYLDSSRSVLAKGITVDNALNAFRQFLKQ